MIAAAIGTDELEEFDKSVEEAGDNDEDEPLGPAIPDGSPAARKQARVADGAGARVRDMYRTDDDIRALGTRDIDDKTIKSYETLRLVNCAWGRAHASLLPVIPAWTPCAAADS